MKPFSEQTTGYLRSSHEIILFLLHAIKAYVGVELQLHLFLFGTRWGGYSTSRLRPFPLRKIPPELTEHKAGVGPRAHWIISRTAEQNVI